MNKPNESKSDKDAKERMIFIFSSVFFIVGTIGYFLINRDYWLFYLFAHLGAFGIMGIFGCLAGFLAKKKKRGYWTAFMLGSLLPIVLGILAVLFFYVKQDGKLYCGGAVSLLIAILVIMSYSLIRTKRLV